MPRTILLTLLFISSCLVEAQLPSFTEPDSSQVSTLQSLKKITDDLYLMHYGADYYFDKFMSKGIGDLDFDGFVKEYLEIKPDSSLWSCSALMVTNQNGEVFVGRNFDWENIPGMILFTDPDSGYSSVSMVPMDLIFNKGATTATDNLKLLWAPYFPVEGMNEKGLVIAELAVEGETVKDISKPSMLSLQLVRLVLDYAADLDEAVRLLGKYNNNSSHRTHFLIADAGGNSAVIEYLEDEMVITENDDPYQVVTNDMVYKNSPKRLSKQCNRYNYIYQNLSSNHRALSAPGIMMILRSVAVEKAYSSQFDIYSSTQWSVIYDLGERSLSIYSRRDFRNEYHYELAR